MKKNYSQYDTKLVDYMRMGFEKENQKMYEEALEQPFSPEDNAGKWQQVIVSLKPTRESITPEPSPLRIAATWAYLNMELDDEDNIELREGLEKAGVDINDRRASLREAVKIVGDKKLQEMGLVGSQGLKYEEPMETLESCSALMWANPELEGEMNRQYDDMEKAKIDYDTTVTENKFFSENAKNYMKSLIYTCEAGYMGVDLDSRYQEVHTDMSKVAGVPSNNYDMNKLITARFNMNEYVDEILNPEIGNNPENKTKNDVSLSVRDHLRDFHKYCTIELEYNKAKKYGETEMADKLESDLAKAKSSYDKSFKTYVKALNVEKSNSLEEHLNTLNETKGKKNFFLGGDSKNFKNMLSAVDKMQKAYKGLDENGNAKDYTPEELAAIQESTKNSLVTYLQGSLSDKKAKESVNNILQGKFGAESEIDSILETKGTEVGKKRCEVALNLLSEITNGKYNAPEKVELPVAKSKAVDIQNDITKGGKQVGTTEKVITKDKEKANDFSFE